MRSVTDRMYRGIGLCREGHPKEAPARQAEAGVEEIKISQFNPQLWRPAEHRFRFVAAAGEMP